MRLAHVLERNAPAGAPWRLAAALDATGASWLDLEVARRRAIAARRTLEHDFALFRRPVTTLDEHLAQGLRVAALADLVEGFEARDVERLHQPAVRQVVHPIWTGALRAAGRLERLRGGAVDRVRLSPRNQS